MNLPRTRQSVWNSIRMNTLEIHMFWFVCVFPVFAFPCHFFRSLVPSLPSLSEFIWLFLFVLPVCFPTMMVTNYKSFHSTSWKIHVVNPIWGNRTGNFDCVLQYLSKEARYSSLYILSLWHSWNVSQKFYWCPNFGCSCFIHHWIHSTSTDVEGATLLETSSVETIAVHIVCLMSVHPSWWHLCSGKNWGPGINEVVVHFVLDGCADFKWSENCITTSLFQVWAGSECQGR